jgi:hypothetical protein
MVLPNRVPQSVVSSALPLAAAWPKSVPSRIGGAGTLLHHDPTMAFDNVLATLPYATVVTEVRRSGRFVLVETPVGIGWVLTDAVLEEIHVLPQFKLGYTYDAEQSEVRKLRSSIGDCFSGQLAGVALMGVEYVTYKLKQAGRTIAWPQTYNRLAGTWQRKLRGVRGIHIDVLPHTGSVMEYIIDEVGYVAYVEKVAPDLKITVSGIGLTHESQYTEQVLLHNVWRELRPVFIQVS